jgi:primase-polymerase (primpol)-like protein
VPPISEQGAAVQKPGSRLEQYPVSDLELWERIFTHDKYGADHLRRFQGDNALDRGDHSFTVIRLLNCLARWTHCDPIRMRNMILLSPLANEKWFEKRGGGDWLDHQIADAIAYVSRK